MEGEKEVWKGFEGVRTRKMTSWVSPRCGVKDIGGHEAMSDIFNVRVKCRYSLIIH